MNGKCCHASAVLCTEVEHLDNRLSSLNKELRQTSSGDITVYYPLKAERDAIQQQRDRLAVGIIDQEK